MQSQHHALMKYIDCVDITLTVTMGPEKLHQWKGTMDYVYKEYKIMKLKITH